METVAKLDQRLSSIEKWRWFQQGVIAAITIIASFSGTAFALLKFLHK